MTHFEQTGGQAYPRAEETEEGGMTMLEYFAAHALVGLLMRKMPFDSSEELARLSYDIAAAMVGEYRRRVD